MSKVEGSQGPRPTFVSSSGKPTRRRSNGNSPEMLPLLGRPLGPADLTLVCGTYRFLCRVYIGDSIISQSQSFLAQPDQLKDEIKQESDDEIMRESVQW